MASVKLKECFSLRTLARCYFPSLGIAGCFRQVGYKIHFPKKNCHCFFSLKDGKTRSCRVSTKKFLSGDGGENVSD